MRVWRNIYHANGGQKKARVAILLLDKLDFKTKTITRDKESHYIIIKGAIQPEDITSVNIYAPNIGMPNTSKLITNIKELMENNTIIIGNFNILHTSMY